ncbi:hypothetical protein B0H14DRAFT_3462786 [Mycena olivaceomarginata]|nr:hypothetical protein B0H14DRAFT_3462786 [Mycena olivaceomarginata]
MTRGNNRNKRKGTALAATAGLSSQTSHIFNIAALVTPAEAAPIESYVDRVSANGRSIVRESVRVEPPSPLKRAHLGIQTAEAASAAGTVTFDVADTEHYVMDEEDVDDPPCPSFASRA